MKITLENDSANVLLTSAVDGLRDYVERAHGGNVAAARRALGLGSILDAWLNGTRTPSFSKIGPVLEQINAKLVFPDHPRETAREVCFVDTKIVEAGNGAPPPLSENYFAVPLVGEVGAGPGIMPEDKIESWVLVYRNHHSVQRRSNLLAVEVGRHQRSMIPTLHPFDIVLVDRNDFGEFGYTPPGNIFLVREPGQEGGGMVKRVSMSGKEEKSLITFYSDNATEYAPETYPMSHYDFDIKQAIVGRVVWAWADLSRK